jgi:hypothetical protein
MDKSAKSTCRVKYPAENDHPHGATLILLVSRGSWGYHGCLKSPIRAHWQRLASPTPDYPLTIIYISHLFRFTGRLMSEWEVPRLGADDELRLGTSDGSQCFKPVANSFPKPSAVRYP